MNEDFLNRKLQQRREANAFRALPAISRGIDFCSNDYLGIVTDGLIGSISEQTLQHGSTGSRLISGNYPLLEDLESTIATFHEAPAAVLFNSGYDANLGLLACVPQRHDTVLYDRLSHASIRDGIRLSGADAHAFEHNDLKDLEKKLREAKGNLFVVTESVFSMDGDVAPLNDIGRICESHGAMLIVDEAHATGVMGNKGEGMVQTLNLQCKCFARIHTFGKALGCHGAAVLGSRLLKDYLVNFSRPFIYTTAMPPTMAQAITSAYRIFPELWVQRQQLVALVKQFRKNCHNLRLTNSVTPIQGVILPGNEEVKQVAAALQTAGIEVRAILYPTVPKGQERLRIVLHSFNTAAQVDLLAGKLLAAVAKPITNCRL